MIRPSQNHISKLANPAAPGYGANVKRTGIFDTQINPKPLPTFPDLDYMPGESTALNDVVLTKDNLRFSSTPQDNAERQNLRYQTSVAALHGYRTPRQTLSVFPKIKKHNDYMPEPQLDVDVYMKTMASAEHGYRKLDNSVYQRVQMGGKGPKGFSTFMRADGLERDANSSIHKEARKGLSFDTPAAKPMIQTVAPNHNKVAPVLAATRHF
jgi:hypothetical protein